MCPPTASVLCNRSCDTAVNAFKLIVRPRQARSPAYARGRSHFNPGVEQTVAAKKCKTQTVRRMEAAWQQASNRVCPDLGTEPKERVGQVVGLNRRLTGRQTSPARSGRHGP